MKKTSKKKILKNPVKFTGSEIKKRIITIVSEILNIPKKDVTAAKKFESEMGMDSLGALEILAAIETTFKIEIPEEALQKIVDLEALIDLTSEILNKKKK
ncbi:MAG: phosphopantetheine-binding protein [Candidatus Aadella gelida]|nr:phosphopantetheine-binding protein [Candidatus Aadella gelida]